MTRSWTAELLGLGHLGLPVALSLLARFLLNVTDIAFVGHLGKREFAAAALSLVWLSVTVVPIARALGSSVNALCSQAYGAERPEMVGLWFRVASAMLTLASLPVAGLWLLTSRALVVMNVEEATRDLAQRFALLSIPWIWPFIMATTLGSYLQAQGTVYPQLAVNGAAVGVNIGLNWLLVRGVGGYGGYGFDGSPIATSITRWLVALALIAYAFGPALRWRCGCARAEPRAPRRKLKASRAPLAATAGPAAVAVPASAKPPSRAATEADASAAQALLLGDASAGVAASAAGTQWYGASDDVVVGGGDREPAAPRLHHLAPGREATPRTASMAASLAALTPHSYEAAVDRAALAACSWSDPPVRASHVREMARQVALNGVVGALEELQLQLIALFAGWVGEAEVAAFTAVVQMYFVISSAMFGVENALAVRVAQAVGRQDVAAAKHSMRVAFWAALSVSVAVAVAMLLLRASLGHIYTSDAQILALTERSFPLIGACYVVMTVFYVAMAVLQAQARPGVVAIAFLVGAWLVCVPLAYVLALRVRLGLAGLWYALIAGYGTVTAIASVGVLRSDWAAVLRRAKERHAAAPLVAAARADDDDDDDQGGYLPSTHGGGA